MIYVLVLPGVGVVGSYLVILCFLSPGVGVSIIDVSFRILPGVGVVCSYLVILSFLVPGVGDSITGVFIFSLE